MSFSENGSMSPADYAAINGNNGFGFGGDGAWWVIILLLLAGNGGWGNGFGVAMRCLTSTTRRHRTM
jgi:hypothetical protein